MATSWGSGCVPTEIVSFTYEDFVIDNLKEDKKTIVCIVLFSSGPNIF